jgi:hypothetical protein
MEAHELSRQAARYEPGRADPLRSTRHDQLSNVRRHPAQGGRHREAQTADDEQSPLLG